MNKNKRKDMTPYPMGERPEKPSWLILPVMWAAAWFMTRKGGLKIKKKDMDGLKPPYLVLAQHQGFLDYAIAPLALFPRRASYVSDVEGYANYGKKLYSMLGCIPTRRFVPDVALVHNINHALHRNKNIVVLFPEARHSNVGTASLLPRTCGRLVKYLNVPVVVMKTKGSYLSCPIWDEDHQRKAPVEVTLEKILGQQDIKRLSAAEIQELVEGHFVYDEYRWQLEQRIAISHPRRAEGLHKMLYQCPVCLSEFSTNSQGDTLRCENCGRVWKMNEYGQLQLTRRPCRDTPSSACGESANGKAVNCKTTSSKVANKKTPNRKAASKKAVSQEVDSRLFHIPDWYEFQREQVEEEIEAGGYGIQMEVEIEALPSHKGFVPLGRGVLRHDERGFCLVVNDTKEQLEFPVSSMISVHTEYDYRKKGDCLVLSARDCCYYIYCADASFNVTKIQFAAEIMHERQAQESRDRKAGPDSGKECSARLRKTTLPSGRAAQQPDLELN